MEDVTQELADGFDADTLVTLSDGGTVPIALIEEASKDANHPRQFTVLSYNEKSKEFESKPVITVTKSQLSENDKILRITCEARTQKGTYIISVLTTSNRSFQTSNRKTQASLLETGDMVVGLLNGNQTLLKITNIKRAKVSTPVVYNLIVADSNNFLVGGKNSILAAN